MRHLIRFVLPLFCCLLIFQISVFAQNAWQAGVLYTVNSVVTYQTATYKCLQQHTSQISWEPPNAPSLWQLQAGGGTNPNAVFADDFETERGWTLNAGGSDSANAGMWERGVPQNTAYMGVKQTTAHGGNAALVTGLAGGKTYENDVDGGVTTVRSPAINLPSSGTISLSFWYYFAHSQRSSADDYFKVKIIGANQTQTVLQKFSRYRNANAIWEQKTIILNDFAGQMIRVQFEAADFAGDSTIEAAIDDLEITATEGGTNPGGGFPARFFAPYVDTLLYPPFPLAQTANQTGLKYFTLAFIVNGSSNCQASWGGVIPLSENHMVADVNALRAAGGDVIMSFGGASGVELAQSCVSVSSLQAQYQAVIDKYNLTSVDFDIEGGAIADAAANNRRGQAIAALQNYAHSQSRELKVSFTLPVLPSGLDQNSISLLQNTVASGVEITTVNIMAMDYGAVANPNTMGQNAIDAINATVAQLAVVYPNKSLIQRQAMIGVTPMIGLNDVSPEVFTMSDANLLLNFVQNNNIGRIAMWSITRDKSCNGSAQVSPTCSGISQQPFDFSNVFKQIH